MIACIVIATNPLHFSSDVLAYRDAFLMYASAPTNHTPISPHRHNHGTVTRSDFSPIWMLSWVYPGPSSSSGASFCPPLLHTTFRLATGPGCQPPCLCPWSSFWTPRTSSCARGRYLDRFRCRTVVGALVSRRKPICGSSEACYQVGVIYSLLGRCCVCSQIVVDYHTEDLPMIQTILERMQSHLTAAVVSNDVHFQQEVVLNLISTCPPVRLSVSRRPTINRFWPTR